MLRRSTSQYYVVIERKVRGLSIVMFSLLRLRMFAHEEALKWLLTGARSPSHVEPSHLVLVVNEVALGPLCLRRGWSSVILPTSKQLHPQLHALSLIVQQLVIHTRLSNTFWHCIVLCRGQLSQLGSDRTQYTTSQISIPRPYTLHPAFHLATSIAAPESIIPSKLTQYCQNGIRHLCTNS